MSLLDQISSLLGSTAQGEQATGGVMPHLVEMLGSQPGGLNGLIEKFNSAGAGDIIKSWIGTGPNQAPSTDLIHRVLGSEQVQALAAKTGLPIDQVLAQLQTHLPAAVDGMTPDGQVPTTPGGLMEAGLSFLKSRISAA